jgi:hypothetical protein
MYDPATTAPADADLGQRVLALLSRGPLTARVLHRRLFGTRAPNVALLESVLRALWVDGRVRCRDGGVRWELAREEQRPW